MTVQSGCALKGTVAVASLALALGLGTPATAHAQNQDGMRPLQQLREQLLGGSHIGVNVRDVEEADVSRDKLPADTGVVVESVEPDSPADRAGIKGGDVIINFDGERVRSARQLTRLVSETPDGREVPATVVRDGSHVDLKVRPEEAQPFAQNGPRARRPNAPNPPNGPFLMRRPNRPAGRSAANDRGRLGVTAEDLTPQLGDYFGASSGALVTSVTNGSAADSAGVKAGDVITKVNGDAVKDASDLADKVDAASGRTSLTVVREHHERTLTANLGSPDNTERSSGPRQITK